MLIRDGAPGRRGRAPGTLLARLRQRTARLGALVVFLSALAAALAVFVACACKTVR